MSAHLSTLCFCSLLMCLQYAFAQEVKGQVSADQTGTSKVLPVEAQKKDLLGNRELVSEKNLATPPDQAVGNLDFYVPAVPTLAESAQTGNGQGMYARVTKEYYSQANKLNGKQERPETLSKFGFRYSPTDKDHLWLEYRFSDKGALRLRGAGHGGVKILAVWEY